VGFFSRLAAPFRRKSSEGYVWPSRANTWNWWQFTNSRTTREFADFAPVFACWRIISEEVARVPIQVVRTDDRGIRQVISNKAPTRVFRRPNSYQTASDLKMALTQSLLSDGNAYAFAVRNDRFGIAEMYPVRPSNVSVYIDHEDGSVYYHVADSDVLALSQVDTGYWFPARDMLHIRLFSYNHPLTGVTPLTAAALGVNAGLNIGAQTAAFFGNMARPSGIIKHPKPLKKEAVQKIKETFMQAASGDQAGAPIVFSEGMDWEPMAMTAVDAELIQSYNLTERQVAQIYRVPFFFLNEMADMKLGSVESLTRYFINSGLGFYFTHLAEALTKFFALPPNESIIFDYESALLQGDFEARMEAYKTGVQGGIYTVNEARGREGLSPVEYGDDVRMQQQMVPLSYGVAVQPPAASSVPVEPEEPEEPEEPAEPEMTDADRRLQVLQIKRQLRQRLVA